MTKHEEEERSLDPCPRSEIPFWPSFLTALLFVSAIIAAITFSEQIRSAFDGIRNALNLTSETDVLIGLVIILLSVLPMLFADLKKLNMQRVVGQTDAERVLYKIIGLWGTLISLSFIYWLLPEYGEWYQRFWDLLWIVMPIFIVCSPFYIIFADKRTRQPEDTYYHTGLAFMGLFSRRHWKHCESSYVEEHARQWVIKGFFLPLMSIFYFNDISALLDFDISSIKQSFSFLYDFSFLFLYSIDVLYAVIGYFFTFKVLNTEIRSAEPSLLGWLVCLACYPPFWNGLLGQVYFNYDNDYFWGQWLSGSPIFYAVWGLTILFFIGVYVLATISLGYRFSNLTYRGLTTSGVYRWTKHPAYIAKNITWWMISIPFISESGGGEAIRSCLLLFGVNYLYYLRAKTEERHLSHYPEYVAYAEWINRNGIFRWFKYLSPSFTYSREATLALATAPWWHRVK